VKEKRKEYYRSEGEKTIIYQCPPYAGGKKFSNENRQRCRKGLNSNKNEKKEGFGN